MATSWNSYGWIFDVNGFRIPYIPLINDWTKEEFSLARNNINFHTDSSKKKQINFEINEIPKGVKQSERCAIDLYTLNDGKLLIHFIKTTYIDYYVSNEHLDELIDESKTLTYREKFGQLLTNKKYGTLRSFDLSNICGVGLLLLTSDNKILMRKQRYDKRIYPGRITFFASGTIHWGVYPDPYLEIVRKSFIEMGHQINIDNLEMILFGVDARKLFFQFSFLEKTNAKFNEINQFIPKDQELVDFIFDLQYIVEEFFKHTWEPAAIATLITILSREFGEDKVKNEIHKHFSYWHKHEMHEEWDYRANRDGDLSVMSVRYPKQNIVEKSVDYVDFALNFIGSDIKNKYVVEVGAGNGRFTEKLLNICKKLTSIECSSLMVKKLEQRIGSNSHLSIINNFAQNVLPIKKPKVDIIICSLVLIHNVNENFYKELIDKMCKTANSLYVFEDTSQNRSTSPHTKLRSREKLICDFKEFGFSVIKKDQYDLYEDNISLFNFKKCEGR